MMAKSVGWLAGSGTLCFSLPKVIKVEHQDIKIVQQPKIWNLTAWVKAHVFCSHRALSLHQEVGTLLPTPPPHTPPHAVLVLLSSVLQPPWYYLPHAVSLDWVRG